MAVKRTAAGRQARKLRSFNPGSALRDEEPLYDRPWTVNYVDEDSTAAVNAIKGLAFVPNTTTAMGEAIRIHELMHLRWSPMQPPKGDTNKGRLTKLVEDARIHHLGIRAGVGEVLKPIVRRGDFIGSAPLMPRPTFKRNAMIWDVLNSDVDGVDSFGWTEAKVEELERLRLPPIDSVDAPEMSSDGDPAGGGGAGNCLNIYEYASTKGWWDTARDTPTDARLVWVPPEVVLLERSVRIPSDSRSSSVNKRLSRMGSAPYKLMKLAQGGRWVKRKGRVPAPSGSVVIDMSGSMGLRTADVVKLATAVRAGAVAGYYGYQVKLPYGPFQWRVAARLIVFSAMGFRASEEVITKELSCKLGGMNLCDGPALEWLASQPGPRIWVSDGGVTMAYAKPGYSSEEGGGDPECRLLRQDHNITMVTSPKEVIPMLATLRGGE